MLVYMSFYMFLCVCACATTHSENRNKTAKHSKRIGELTGKWRANQPTAACHMYVNCFNLHNLPSQSAGAPANMLHCFLYTFKWHSYAPLTRVNAANMCMASMYVYL